MIANAGNPAPAARAARRPPLDPILSLAAAVTVFAVYVKTMNEIESGREALHIFLSCGNAAALLPWGKLARHANRDA